MNGNHNEEEKVKYCQIVKDYCIKERCNFYVEMVQHVAGMQKKMGMCWFNAILMVLSEMNAKTVMPQQKIPLPNLYRG